LTEIDPWHETDLDCFMRQTIHTRYH